MGKEPIPSDYLTQEMQAEDLLGKNIPTQEPQSKFVEKLLEDGLVKRKLDNFDIWAGLSKTLKLTFLEPLDEVNLMNLFEYSVCLYSIEHPEEIKKLETSQKINQARIMTICNIKRAIGTINPNKKNERISISTERRESIALNPEATRPSFIKRLFGLGGGK
jgi:hypothetical protein